MMQLRCDTFTTNSFIINTKTNDFYQILEEKFDIQEKI